LGKGSGTMLFGAIVWIVLVGFYFLLAGEISLTETIAGLPTAAVAAGFALALRRTETQRLRLQAPWLHVIAKPLASVLPDVFRVGRVLLSVLWRRPSGPIGAVARQPFRHGGDDAKSAGRRALVTLGISFAPNGYVLSSPGEMDALVLHRLALVPPEPDREWPL
jgi:hypothetical protein